MRRKQAAAEKRAERVAAKQACEQMRKELQEMHDAKALAREGPDGTLTYLSEAERAATDMLSGGTFGDAGAVCTEDDALAHRTAAEGRDHVVAQDPRGD